jgi:hypothetical protein
MTADAKQPLAVHGKNPNNLRGDPIPQDELIAPLSWAQRLERVFERAAFGLILPSALCVTTLCVSSLTSLTQTSFTRSWITSKHNHHRINLWQLSRCGGRRRDTPDVSPLQPRAGYINQKSFDIAPL